MMRWMRGSEADHREVVPFDPIAEGDRHRLSADVSLAIWAHVSGDAASDDHARRRFDEIAVRLATRGGRLRPDPGRVPLDDAVPRSGSTIADELVSGAPGKITAVTAARAKPWRHDPRRDGFDDAAPGKVTRLEVDAWRMRGAGSRLRHPREAMAAPARPRSPWDAVGVAAAQVLARGADQAQHAALLFRQHAEHDIGDPDHPAVQEALRRRGGGSPLPDAVRREMEARLGVDLRSVRVHTDDVADEATRAVRAKAFTVGEDIFFAKGELVHGGGAGAELLAHELTHVVQGWQGRVPVAGAGTVQVSQPDDALEREAEATSRGAMRAAAPVMPPDGGAPPSAMLQRTPEVAAQLISRYTSWGNLNEAALGRALLGLATRGQVALADDVMTALGSTDRDDVAYEFMLVASDAQLVALAAAPTSRRFLDRLFDELTSGSVAAEEQQQADRIHRINARQTVSAGAFDAAATSGQTKIFPFRLPGFTVLHDAPIEARRERGGIWAHSFVRVLGTGEFRAETSTLPSAYFLGGIVLPENEVIGVRLYDQGGIIHYTTPLFLIQLANATDQQILEKVLEAAGIGLTLGTGVLAGLGVEASMAARVLLWADRASFVLGTITSVLREHRSWLVGQFGPGFMDAVDVVHSAAAIYGMARIALEAPRMVLALRTSFRTWRAAATSRSPSFSTSERAAIQQVTQSTDELLQQVDQIQSARPGPARTTPGTPGPDATAPTPTGPTRSPHEQLVDVLDQRVQQIQAARGDLNLFRAAFRRVSGSGNTARPVADLAPELEQLLTQFRRSRVVTGGGRGGTGVSTYIESLDGRFAIRITHNQVGPTPVGSPPMPRIHIYEGAVSGHGAHVVLPAGTTLADILAALHITP
jgi:hypothetical protein